MNKRHGFFFYVCVATFCIFFSPIIIATAAARMLDMVLVGRLLHQDSLLPAPQNESEMQDRSIYLYRRKKQFTSISTIAGILLAVLLVVPIVHRTSNNFIPTLDETPSSVDIVALESSTAESSIESSVVFSEPESEVSISEASSELSKIPKAESSLESSFSEKSENELSESTSFENNSEIAPSIESTNKLSEEESLVEPVTEIEADSESPEETENEQVLQLISITDFVSPNSQARVKVQGLPSTEYSITVEYASGPATAQGVTGDNKTKISDSNGYVSWSWKIGGNTNKNTPDYRPKVTIQGGGEVLSTDFAVIR